MDLKDQLDQALMQLGLSHARSQEHDPLAAMMHAQMAIGHALVALVIFFSEDPDRP